MSDRRGSGSDQGETLMELLVTVLLMSGAILALITAIFTLVQASDRYSRHTRANVLAHEAAESVKLAVDDWEYVPCATLSTYPTQLTGDLPLPAGWTARITKVERTQLDTVDPANPTMPRKLTLQSGQVRWFPTTAQCSADPANRYIDGGLQRITVLVTSQAGDKRPVREEVVVVKRNQDCFAFGVQTYGNFDDRPC